MEAASRASRASRASGPTYRGTIPGLDVLISVAEFGIRIQFSVMFHTTFEKSRDNMGYHED